MVQFFAPRPLKLVAQSFWLVCRESFAFVPSKYPATRHSTPLNHHLQASNSKPNCIFKWTEPLKIGLQNQPVWTAKLTTILWKDIVLWGEMMRTQSHLHFVWLTYKSLLCVQTNKKKERFNRVSLTQAQCGCFFLPALLNRSPLLANGHWIAWYSNLAIWEEHCVLRTMQAFCESGPQNPMLHWKISPHYT